MDHHKVTHIMTSQKNLQMTITLDSQRNRIVMSSPDSSQSNSHSDFTAKSPNDFQFKVIIIQMKNHFLVHRSNCDSRDNFGRDSYAISTGCTVEIVPIC